MHLVVFVLYLAAAVGLVYRPLHAARYGIGIHDDSALGVSSGTPYRLHERSFASQKALFVGVENGDELYLGQVEPLAEQVYAAEHIELAAPEAVYYVYPLERIDVAVHILNFERMLL